MTDRSRGLWTDPQFLPGVPDFLGQLDDSGWLQTWDMKVLTPDDLPVAIQAVQGLRHLFEMVAAEYRDVEYRDVSRSYVLALVDSLVLELQAVVAGSQSRALEPASDEETRKNPTQSDPRIDHLKTYTAAFAYFAISNRLAASSKVYLDLSGILSQHGCRKSQSTIRYWVEKSHSHVTELNLSGRKTLSIPIFYLRPRAVYLHRVSKQWREKQSSQKSSSGEKSRFVKGGHYADKYRSLILHSGRPRTSRTQERKHDRTYSPFVHSQRSYAAHKFEPRDHIPSDRRRAAEGSEMWQAHPNQAQRS